MFSLVQLTDGCYKVTVDFAVDGFGFHREYTFRESDSNAKPLENGENIRIKFANEQ